VVRAGTPAPTTGLVASVSCLAMADHAQVCPSDLHLPLALSMRSNI
jgi:hypothetical protein